MPAVVIPITAAGVIKGIKAFDDLSQTIASPPEGRAIEGAVGRAGQTFCDFVGGNPLAAFGVLGPVIGPAALLCKPYWDGAGYGAPVPGEPPFTGGQCPIQYGIGTLGSTTCPAFAGDWSGFTSGPGPITQLTSSTVDTGMFPAPLLTTWTATFSDGDRTFSIRHNIGVTPCVRVYPLEPSTPDDCGNPPPTVPFEPGTNPPPVPPDYVPGVDFGIDGGQPFFFVPSVENPIDPDDPLDFDPTEPAPPAPPVPESNPAGGPDSVGPGGAVGGGAGGAGEDEDFGAAPAGRVWIGAIAEFNAAASYGNIPGTGPENTVYPRVVGNISLIYGSVRGQALQVRSRWMEVMRPTDALAVTGCRVNSLPGVDVTLYPISAPICPEGAPCSVE